MKAKLMNGMLTHTPARERFSLEDIREKFTGIQSHLKNCVNLSSEEKMVLHAEAELLSQTELGRFLIMNDGAISGWWTYYCILGYKNYAITNLLEKFLLEEAPVFLATRERFGHFQSIIRQQIEENSAIDQPMKLATIPGGMAADLLTLDLSGDLNIDNLQFINIDLDDAVLSLAIDLAKQLNSEIPLTCYHEDAWALSAHEEYDLVASNGLNIYVPDREKVVALYKGLFATLKPGGTLVTSTLTPPPYDPQCEWHREKIDQVALARQASVFAQLLQATWSNFCTTPEMLSRLTEAGFVDIKVIPDLANIFPTFVGKKPFKVS